jgi:hypothetical protein
MGSSTPLTMVSGPVGTRDPKLYRNRGGFGSPLLMAVLAALGAAMLNAIRLDRVAL